MLAAVTTLAVSSARAAAPVSAASARGTYRLHGTAHVVARPALSRTVEVHADVVLRPGTVRREVLVRVAAEGYTCDLVASVGAAGALEFGRDQRCVVDVRSRDTRGHLDGKLRAGSGRLADGELSLQLAWDVSGSLGFRAGRRVEVGGAEVDLPAVWTPEVPVRGEAQASASGRRDASRAADPVR